jgi:hypothetical protein
VALAVFIVVKKMDPSAQIRRMRELQQTGVMVVSPEVLQIAPQTEELHKLRGEGGSKEHIP